MSEIVIYEDGNVELKTVVEDETIWLSDLMKNTGV